MSFLKITAGHTNLDHKKNGDLFLLQQLQLDLLVHYIQKIQCLLVRLPRENVLIHDSEGHVSLLSVGRPKKIWKENYLLLSKLVKSLNTWKIIMMNLMKLWENCRSADICLLLLLCVTLMFEGDKHGVARNYKQRPWNT